MTTAQRIVTVTQGTPEWHAFRLLGIGGSEAPALEGSCPYRTARDVAKIKLQMIEEDNGDKEFIFAKGHKTEGLIRREFAQQTGIEMAPLCLIHPTHDHIRASLDGFDGYKYGVLEAKLVGKGVLEDARDEGIIPRHHWVQIQHNMEVAGVDLAQWFGHNGSDNGILIEVKRDAKFIREQLAREHDFWALIKERVLPPLTKRDELEPLDLAVLQELRDAKEFLDNAEANYDAVKAKLDSYGHPLVRGAGVLARKGSRQGSIDVKKIPGIKTLLDGYTERYLEKFRGTPSKESWTVTIDRKAK